MFKFHIRHSRFLFIFLINKKFERLMTCQQRTTLIYPWQSVNIKNIIKEKLTGSCYLKFLLIKCNRNIEYNVKVTSLCTAYVFQLHVTTNIGNKTHLISSWYS